MQELEDKLAGVGDLNRFKTLITGSFDPEY